MTTNAKRLLASHAIALTLGATSTLVGLRCYGDTLAGYGFAVSAWIANASHGATFAVEVQPSLTVAQATPVKAGRK
jgi:hypothetical protein